MPADLSLFFQLSPNIETRCSHTLQILGPNLHECVGVETIVYMTGVLT